MRGCLLEVQTMSKRDSVSRNTGTRGLANLHSDLTNFLGEGRNKSLERQSLWSGGDLQTAGEAAPPWP